MCAPIVGHLMSLPLTQPCSLKPWERLWLALKPSGEGRLALEKTERCSEELPGHSRGTFGTDELTQDRSEIDCNYHFKGRTPVLLREHTYAVHALLYLQERMVPHSFSVSISFLRLSVLLVVRETVRVKEYLWPQSHSPAPQKLGTSLHSLPRSAKSTQGEL